AVAGGVRAGEQAADHVVDPPVPEVVAVAGVPGVGETLEVQLPVTELPGIRAEAITDDVVDVTGAPATVALMPPAVPDSTSPAVEKPAAEPVVPRPAVAVDELPISSFDETEESDDGVVTEIKLHEPYAEPPPAVRPEEQLPDEDL